MSSLSERMNVIPTIKVDIDTDYRYELVSHGITIGEFMFKVEEISYDKDGVREIGFMVTDPCSLRRIKINLK